jgi:two-component SAPR family response regulator
VRGWRHRPRRRIVTALLCYLVLHPGRPVTGDQLLVALWPLGSSRKEATRPSLHTYVSDLRRALPEGMVPDAASSDGYMLVGGVPTDWGTFVELVRQAEDAMPLDAAKLWAQALSLVRGAPFAGATSDMYEWVIGEHHLAAMEVTITECAHALSSWRLRAGDAVGASDAARIGLLAVPDSYVLHADIIRATRAGTDPAALRRAWRAARSALGTEGVSALLDELGGDAPLHGLS